MSDLDHELRAALKRKDPPANFTAQVLARVEAKRPASRWNDWLAAPFMQWAAVAALFLIVISAGAVREWRLQQERVAGEQAKQQVELALHIAGSKLHMAEAKVQQLSDRP